MPAEFDRAGYERRVVRPLRGRDGQLPAHVADMYDIDPAMTPRQIADRLAEVRAYWRDTEAAGGFVGSVCASLRAADADMASAGDAMLDPGWWTAGQDFDRTGEPVGQPDPGPQPRDMPAVATPEPPRARPVATQPVYDVQVTTDGTGVRVTWRPPATAPDAPCHVIRTVGRVPSGLDDGDLVAVTTAGEALDPRPPIGPGIGYAVVATAADHDPAEPVGVVARIVPPVGDVRITGERTAVHGRWAVHPDAVAVEVYRGAGPVPAPVAVVDRTAFRDAAAAVGVEHEYSLVAIYRDGPATLRAEPVVVRAAVRPEPVPVADLATRAVGGSATLRVSVVWRQEVGAEVAVRYSDAPCPWPYRQTVGPDQVAGFGTELVGDRTASPGRTTLESDVPSGTGYVTAFTRTDDGWIRGADVVLDIVRPVSDLDAQRRGGEVVLGWIWPPDVGVAQIDWTGGVERVTRQQYVTDGGFRVRCSRDAQAFAVRAVVLGPDRSVHRSEPVTVGLAAQRVPVRYSITRTGSRIRRTERCVATLSCEDTVDSCTVAVTLTSGEVMPTDPRQAHELVRQVIELRAGEAVDVAADLPRVARPYWLRVFVVDDSPVRLVDPSVSQMKVT